MKRFMAMFLAAVMTLGMAMSALAATRESATITVGNAEGATLTYLQVIEPKSTTETGWTFITDSIAKDFTDAFGLSAEQDQLAIAMLIKAQNTAIPELAPSIVKTATAATNVQIQQAFDNVINNQDLGDMENPQTVTEAGLYAIKAVQSGYTYRAMAAYVGFDTVTIDGTTYEYPSLKDAPLEAKKIPTTITKADNDENDAVAIGQVITYTVETDFPYFNQKDQNKYFAVSDAIVGAEYTKLNGEDQTAKVVIGGEDVTKKVTFEEDEANDTFTVNLTQFIDAENSKASQKVVITYQAIVDEVQVVNGATSHVGTDEYDSNPVNLYTGKITLTKIDADDDSVKLADAGFQVKNGDVVLTFIQKDEAKKVYTYDPTGTIVEVFTDGEGNVVVEGLDIGTYTFVEKTAPAGYSINENAEEIELDIKDEGEAVDGKAVKIYANAGSIADTKLLALPGTGGVGTTIFTVGGCAVMIAAAFLFFASRRKEESK